MILILGAGLAGLSASYHLGHERCLILEKEPLPYGHIGSTQRDGFTWDTGPHVSFTKHDYVRELFSASVGGAFDEYEVRVANYYQGHWIAHPAQTSLYQVPEPMRSACLESFLATRESESASAAPASSYMQWLTRAFGPVFANTFPAAYTRKYWTRDANDLATDWIGDRIHYPNIDDVVEGSRGQLPRSTHYISKVRYPRSGGYEAFARKLKEGSNIRFGSEVSAIDLEREQVWLSDGQCIKYTRLVNTLPLPIFVNACMNAPQEIKEQARRLSCTQLLLVNVAAPHATRRPENWMYVYDEDKFSTRINCTELLTPGNAPSGWTGVQAEVYFSRHRPLTLQPEAVAAKVESELIEMGLIDPSQFAPGTRSHRHMRLSQWANVIFDHGTAPALDAIWSWLEAYGLQREDDDVSPLTDWIKPPSPRPTSGKLAMAGRFGQWKYYWSDDCVLRGKRLADMAHHAGQATPN
jgi:protoporphyrinogen oxidase